MTGVPGQTIEAGLGLDRRAGDYRVAGNVIWSRRSADTSDLVGRLFDDDDEVERADVSFVAAVDRAFARETRRVRVFAVYDPVDETVFARAILNVSLADDVWLEGSAGILAGESLDTLGLLTRRDFLYTRLKVFF